MVPLIFSMVFMKFFMELAHVNMPLFAELRSGHDTGYIILTALALAGGIIGAYLSKMVENKFEIWKILVALFFVAGTARILFVHIIADDFRRSLAIYVFYVGLGSTIGIFFRVLTQKLPPKKLIARVDAIITSLCGVSAVVGAVLGGFFGRVLFDLDINIDVIFIAHGVFYMFIGLFLCSFKAFRRLPKISEVVADSQEEGTDDTGGGNEHNRADFLE